MTISPLNIDLHHYSSQDTFDRTVDKVPTKPPQGTKMLYIKRVKEIHSMTTLSQLKQRIDQLIETQGEESPVAAFIYTKEDVVQYDDDFNEVEIEDNTIIEDVLYNVEDTDYIYTQIQGVIDDELTQKEVAL